MTIISTSKFLEFKSAKSPSGHDWYYAKRTNDSNVHDSAVAITVLVKGDDEYSFLLMKTKRPPLYSENKANYCIENPAGLIGDTDSNEDLMDCIKKELLEETGLVADEIFIEQKNACTSAGLTSETLTFVTVIVNEYKVIKQPVSDGGIILERFLVKTSEIRNYLKNIDEKENSIASAAVTGIFYALDRI